MTMTTIYAKVRALLTIRPPIQADDIQDEVVTKDENSMEKQEYQSYHLCITPSSVELLRKTQKPAGWENVKRYKWFEPEMVQQNTKMWLSSLTVACLEFLPTWQV